MGNVSVGGLGDEVRPERPVQTSDTKLEMMLEDLVGGPSILSRFRIMNVLSVTHDLALSAIEGPNENDFVLTATAGGSGFSVCESRGIGDTKLEDNLLFRKAKGLRGVFDRIVNLVGAEYIRHDDALQKIWQD